MPDAYPSGKAPPHTEELASGMMAYGEQLIPVLGEDLVSKIFANAWPTRDEGLKECEDFVKEKIKSGNSMNQAIYQAALTAAGHALDDKIV